MDWLLRQFARAYRISQWQRRRFTPAGRGLGYLLIAAAAFGLDTQRTTAFQIFALAAALLLVAWLASLRAQPRLTIERRLPEFATAGEPVRYRQLVRNTGSRPLADLRLRDELADDFPSAEEFRRDRSKSEPGVNWVDRRVGFPRWLALVQRRRGAVIDEVGLPRPAAPVHRRSRHDAGSPAARRPRLRPQPGAAARPAGACQCRQHVGCARQAGRAAAPLPVAAARAAGHPALPARGRELVAKRRGQPGVHRAARVPAGRSGAPHSLAQLRPLRRAGGQGVPGRVLHALRAGAGHLRGRGAGSGRSRRPCPWQPRS